MKQQFSQIIIRLAPLLLLVPLVYWFWFGEGSEFLQRSVNKPSSQKSILVGKEAPDFSIPKERSMKGQEFHLAAEKGGLPILLHFWGTWCGPCVEELPDLIALAKNQQKQMRVVAIAVDRDWQTVGDFFTRYPKLKDLEKNATLLLDPSGDVPALYGTTGLPESFLMRGDLRLETKLVGPQDWLSAQMRALLDRLSRQPQ